jgi:hypothetical protein
MIAISPGFSRLVMFFVLWSTRATATMPGVSHGTFVESILPRAVTANGLPGL